MSDTVENLRKRLEEVEKEIREVEARMPAHSVKPPIMHALFDLEDERDRILKALQEHPDGGPDGPRFSGDEKPSSQPR